MSSFQVYSNAGEKATRYRVGWLASIVRLRCLKKWMTNKRKEPTNSTVAAVLDAGDSAASQSCIVELLRGGDSFLGRRIFMVTV